MTFESLSGNQRVFMSVLKKKSLKSQQQKIIVNYQSVFVDSEDAKRRLDQAFDILFEHVLKNYQQIKKYENEKKV